MRPRGSLQFSSSRHLAPSEVLADTLHTYGDGMMLHAALVRSDIKLTESLLYKALEMMCDKQPALRMRIATEAGRKGGVIKRFLEMDQVSPLLEVTESQADRTAWIKIAEDELQHLVNSSKGPLWKVVFVPMDDAGSRASHHGDFANRRSGTLNIREIKRSSRTSQHSVRSDDIKRTSFQSADGSKRSSLYTASPPKRGSVKSYEPRIRSRSSKRPARSWKFTGMLLFKVHQSIADSLSVLAMIQDQLLPIITAIYKKEEGTLAELSRPLDMKQGVEDTLVGKERLSWLKRRKLRRLAKSVAPQLASPQAVLLPFGKPLFDDTLRISPDSHDERLGVQMLCFSPSPEFSDRLMDECNRHDVTVDDVLMMASALAFGVVSEKHDLNLHQKELICSCPIDLRQFASLMTRQEALGLWLGRQTRKVGPLKDVPTIEKFWSEIRRQTYQASKGKRPWDVLYYNKEISLLNNEQTIAQVDHTFSKCHYKVHVLHKSKKMRGGTLGKPSVVPREQLISLEEHYHVTSLSDVSSAPISLSFTLLEGRLQWCLYFSSRWVSRAFGVHYLEALYDLLRHVVNPGSVRLSKMIHLPAAIRARTLTM